MSGAIIDTEKIKAAKDVLKRAGYIVEALWQIEDAKVAARDIDLDIDDYEAYSIVESAIQSEFAMETINNTIAEFVQEIKNEKDEN